MVTEGTVKLMMNTQIEIIIPTTGTTERCQSLLEAINSVLEQEGVNALPLVILNGNIFDETIFESLQARKDIRFYYQEKGSLPDAIIKGRNLVEAEFYGFLDDDDVLLKGTLALKLNEFKQYSDTDVVVGNGYIGRFGPGQLMHDSLSLSCQKNPLLALLDSNWLASPGGLFKTTSVASDFFIDLPKYFEWSWVAFNLALNGKRIRFIDAPTFYVNDSENSLSKDKENTKAFIDVTMRMLSRSKGHHIHKSLKERLGGAFHCAADQAIQDRSLRQAWYFHFKSLNTFSNLKYLTFTRHLF
jgi:glycosyltransferase involved in cell wall biosynthesis